MTTQLAGKDTFFLPFNQGSNGAGRDGGKGNPPNPKGYPTAYLWERVFQKDSMMDILQKFIHLQVSEEKKLQPDGTEKTVQKKRLIFPRYHQLDVGTITWSSTRRARASPIPSRGRPIGWRRSTMRTTMLSFPASLW